jgi:DNA-binding Lrp family transcriptional regulator
VRSLNCHIGCNYCVFACSNNCSVITDSNLNASVVTAKDLSKYTDYLGFIQGHSDKSNRLASCYISEVACTHQRKETLMSVQAYILIQTEVGKAGSVAKAVSAIAGVTLAEGVTGPYDVIMRAEAPSMEDFGRIILSKVQGVAGITRTLTCPVTHQ